MAEFVSIAKSQVGVRETGNNAGEVEKYQRAAGIAKGSPYCYAGLYWCADSAAKKQNAHNPFYRTGLASLGRQRLTGKLVDSGIVKCELIFWQHPANIFGHVDIAYRNIGGGWYECVGFNTGSNARDGGGVWRVLRNTGHPLARMRVRQIVCIVK